jgi:hypothetical protein
MPGVRALLVPDYHIPFGGVGQEEESCGERVTMDTEVNTVEHLYIELATPNGHVGTSVRWYDGTLEFGALVRWNSRCVRFELGVLVLGTGAVDPVHSNGRPQALVRDCQHRGFAVTNGTRRVVLVGGR